MTRKLKLNLASQFTEMNDMKLNMKPMLLIVEDEPDLLDVIADEVEMLGVLVLKASNGKEALKLLTASTSEQPIDAVLSDLSMPVMDGLTLLGEIRKLGMEIPFLFLSAFCDREKAVQALRLGAMDFLDKPFERQSLQEAIRKAVEYGVRLREFENVLNDLCATTPLSGEQATTFSAVQRAKQMLKKSA